MSTIEAKAATLVIPSALLSAWDGTYRVANTGASQNIPLGAINVPHPWRGCYVRFQAITTDVQLGCSYGAAAQTIVLDQVSAPGTGHASAGYTILAGTFLDVLIPGNATFINYIARTGTGVLEYFKSERPVIR